MNNLSDPYREENIYLTKELSLSRGSLIKNVSYLVTLNLMKGDLYTGSVKITFGLKSIPNY